ncbi:TetR family transcriptional regulator [Phycicoccus sp. HDW14]|uniref:TetR/AcrR family transcriptional regulator n=1 Tax=Phycicoccus sp. HDW14 TaxID=2714941 RepID=UPI00140B0AE2|nr:TetR family transcriptional regulator [Phycicoccus sp. HDW14]QIM21163.1 TetR family transcriptional regulator [Phycicoccus sp. HDW14]
MATSGRRRTPGGGEESARAAETRAALVQGAVQALGEVGFAGASARAIAARAGCTQALVFYHYGSVTDLLLAALDDVSARRLEAYSEALEQAQGLGDLIASARRIFSEDLDAGYVAVLVEMVTGAQSTPGLGEQVAARLAPWRELAEAAVRTAVAGSPVALLVPTREVSHAVVAGLLGLELLAGLDGDREAALALFDRAAQVAALLDVAGAGFAGAPPEGDER